MAEEFENTSQDTQADVKGAGTMLAAPFEIARQDTLTEVQQTVNKTDTTIGDIGDPAGEESLVGLIKNIPETVPTGAVKSVQRGVSSLPSSSSSSEIKITISTINPNKSFVLLTSDTIFGADKSYGQGVRLKELAAEYLVVDSIYKGGMSFSWQVIELF